MKCSLCNKQAAMPESAFCIKCENKVLYKTMPFKYKFRIAWNNSILFIVDLLMKLIIREKTNAQTFTDYATRHFSDSQTAYQHISQQLGQAEQIMMEEAGYERCSDCQHVYPPDEINPITHICHSCHEKMPVAKHYTNWEVL